VNLQLCGRELKATLAFLAVYALLAAGLPFAENTRSAAILPSALLAVTLALLSAIDLNQYRLPDLLTLPLALTGLLVSPWTSSAPLWWHAVSALIGFGVLVALAAAYETVRRRPGLGLGDAKLLAASGAWLGAEKLPDVLLWSAGAALIAVLAGAMRGKHYAPGEAIPFGPYLAFGTWVVWLYGPASSVSIP
jgi:leader peptidase (prepilin peptidase)/N-methyltransferase